MLKKIYLGFLCLGVSYLLISIVLFFLIAPLETTIWGSKIFFISLTVPIRNSFILILIGVAVGLLDFIVTWLRKPKDDRKKGILTMNFILMKFFNPFKKIEYLLFSVLCLGALVRYWGITFGLPETFSRPDEEFIVNASLKFFQGDFNPEFFRYPSLYMYLLYAVFKIYHLFQNMRGINLPIPDYQIVSQDLSEYYLLDRAFSALLGTLTILVVYKLVKLFFDKKVALTSSLFFALAYLHVRDSHFGVTDTPLTFFVLWSLFYIMKSYRDKNLKNYIIAGFISGLSASIKYNGFILVVPMVIVHALNLLEQKGNVFKFILDERILLFISVMSFSFLLGTPYAYWEFDKFIVQFLSEINHLQEGHGINLGRGWLYHLRFSLFYGLGWSFLIFSLVGMVFLFIKDLRKAILLCAFPIIYYIIIGKGFTVFIRYTLPVIPFLCITAGYFLIFIMDQGCNLKISLVRKSSFILALLILLGPSIYNIIGFDSLLTQKDSRLLAKDWIQKNIPAKASIFQTGGGIGKILFFSKDKSEKNLVEEKGGFRYNKTKEDWLELEYSKNDNKFFRGNQEAFILPDYIIIKEHPLKIYSEIPEPIQRLCKEKYQLIKSFEVIELENPNHLFDQQDAFFVPLIGFKHISHPGPNIFIFQKR